MLHLFKTYTSLNKGAIIMNKTILTIKEQQRLDAQDIRSTLIMITVTGAFIICTLATAVIARLI